MRILKIIFGMSLVVSLVLPLSTCTGAVEEGSQKQADRVERYIVSNSSPIEGWAWALAFILPLGVSIAVRKNTSAKAEIASLISVVPAGFVLWAHWVTGKLASGGVIALLSMLGFIVAASVCLTRAITGKAKATASPPL